MANGKFKIVLHEVELEYGLYKESIINMLDFLEDDEAGYMPIEMHENNSSAYGFICSSYYETLGYVPTEIEKVICPVLDDLNNKSSDNLYKLKDGTTIYMY